MDAPCRVSWRMKWLKFGQREGGCETRMFLRAAKSQKGWVANSICCRGGHLQHEPPCFTQSPCACPLVGSQTVAGVGGPPPPQGRASRCDTVLQEKHETMVKWRVRATHGTHAHRCDDQSPVWEGDEVQCCARQYKSSASERNPRPESWTSRRTNQSKPAHPHGNAQACPNNKQWAP